ncbi:MAG: prepilin-type N-terminal cleavage/methylation domain-containing protein [Planctomycetota bacterium]
MRRNRRRQSRAAHRVPGLRARRRGFTLLETMLTLVIVAVGVAGVFDAYQSFFRTNQWSSRTATASLLAAEIRELSRNLPRHDGVTGLTLDISGGGPVAVGWGLEPGEVSVADIDDIDDLDGLLFTFAGDDLQSLEFAGPIDAAGNLVPQYVLTATDQASGATFTYGWQQRVEVTKIDSFDYGTDLDDSYFEAGVPGRGVGDFPLRVTVTVLYQDFFDPEPLPITSVSWIVP